MGAKTGISWTNATANVVVGCDRVSPGCTNCYAERLAATRLKHTDRYKGLAVIRDNGVPRWTGNVRLVPKAIEQILRWEKPRKIFLTAMGDPFHKELSDLEIAVLFGVMAACRQHTFQVLTKRPERMVEWFKNYEVDRIQETTIDWLSEHTEAELGCGSAFDPDDWPLKNVWLGVTAEDQKRADERVPVLLGVPAAKRFVSAEPLLEALDLSAWLDPIAIVCAIAHHRHTNHDCNGGGEGARCNGCGLDWENGRGLDWIIVGGESGPGARRFDIAWARSIVRQCADAKVACFVKQLGAVPVIPESEWRKEGGRLICPGAPDGFARLALQDKAGADPAEWPEDLRVQNFPKVRG